MQHIIKRLGAYSVALCLVGSIGVGCSDGGTQRPQAPQRTGEQIEVGFAHTFVVRTSVLRFTLPKNKEFEGKTAQIRFDGELLEAPFDRTYTATVISDETSGTYVLELPVFGTLWEDVGAEPIDVFTGAIEVEISDSLGMLARGREENVLLEFDETPAPEVSSLERPGDVWPGQRLEVRGRAFLRPDEGTTVAIVEQGTLTRAGSDDPPEDVSGVEVPVRWTGARDVAELPVLPPLVGIHEGRIEGRLRFVNRLDVGTDVDGAAGVLLQGNVQQPRIDAISPQEGSRAQIVRVTGKGFLPTDQEGGYGMLLVYDGGFTPDATPDRTINYRGRSAIQRAPLHVVDHTLIEQDIWYTVTSDFELEGLGAQPGTFEGRIIPVALYQGEEQVGEGVDVRFRVLPTKQMVWVRFMPNFSESLERFGLVNVESEIRQRILEVMRRDYLGVNIEFVESPPTNFNECMTIEIGGPDPTGQGLLGYDNSFNGVPKDIGNLFLQDYLGGYSRQSKDADFSPYGGVFIESFTIFSPTLSETRIAASPVFDMILGEVAPELGGEPVRAAEWPDGPRADAIRRAILMFGNLVGHTGSHEIGHSLGLPYVDGERADEVVYHNRDFGEPFLMDSGGARPFAERAEVQGLGPSYFSPENRAYLDEILPLPE